MMQVVTDDMISCVDMLSVCNNVHRRNVAGDNFVLIPRDIILHCIAAIISQKGS